MDQFMPSWLIELTYINKKSRVKSIKSLKWWFYSHSDTGVNTQWPTQHLGVLSLPDWGCKAPLLHHTPPVPLDKQSSEWAVWEKRLFIRTHSAFTSMTLQKWMSLQRDPLKFKELTPASFSPSLSFDYLSLQTPQCFYRKHIKCLEGTFNWDKIQLLMW